MELKKHIEQFKRDTGYNLIEKDGKPYYGGSLYLEGTGITSLPEGLTVGGSLDLRGTGITSLPEGLTVGGYLDLEGTGITSLPEGLTVGGSLYLEGTGITSLPEGLTVGGYLDLRGTGITSLPEGLTVGGYLDLEGTGITSLPEGLTVGGSLYLRGTGITSHNVNKKLSIDAIRKIRNAIDSPKFWEWNGRHYMKVDDMFTILEAHKGNVYHVRKIGSTERLYVITDGENHFAHGSTLKEAKADLIFKISDRDVSEYKGMSLDDTLSFEEAIAAYRTITGSCAAGTRNYVENFLPKPNKDSYTIREIINLTKGQYGSETFSKFFIK